MKRSMRVLAMILAVVFAVYGFPMTPTSAEEDVSESAVADAAPGEESIFSEDPAAAVDAEAAGEDLENTSNMKFVQTGFDSTTGLLTMTLKIKPTTVTYDGSGVYTGTHISEGFFAFSINPDSVRPYTVKDEGGTLVPDTDLLAMNGTMQYVGGYTGSPLSPNGAKIFTDFATAENTRGNLVNMSFNSAMGGGTKFDDAYSGFFVSAARQSETGLMDCYLQFRIDSRTETVPESDGYVEVANLYFVCYSSELDGFDYAVAESDKELFCTSIQIPDTAQEAKDLVAQFYTMEDDPASPTLALGAAGYVEKRMSWSAANNNWTTLGYASDYYYYLDDERIDTLKATPADSFGNYYWQTKGAWNNGRIPQVVSGTPYLYFTNVDKTYVLEDFTVTNANIFDFEYDPSLGIVPEFYRPAGELNYYPRYSVPTGKQNDANDIAKDWRPESYVPPEVSAAPQRIGLSYDIRTKVSRMSISNPETEDLDAFLESIKWELALRDGTPLSECATREIAGSGTEVAYYEAGSTTPTTVYAVEAYLNGGSYIVWNVYESLSAYQSGEEPIMTTPVGVLMELAESRLSVVKMDEPDDGDTTPGTVVGVMGIAPQLHVTNAAADVRSYLWNDSVSAYNGQIIIKATYTSELGTEYAVDATTVKLYKETPRPDYTTLDVTGVGKVTNDEGSSVTGFEAKIDDDVAAGLPVYSYVYDQYYTRMDKSFSTLTLETEEDIPPGKTNAFAIVQDTADKNKYYITYGKNADGMIYNVNEAVGGLYTLSASCESADVATEPIFVKREDDRLTHLEIVASKGTAGTVGGKKVIYAEVPALDSNGNPRTDSMNLNISVLANQWYLDSASNEAARYDIVQNIRNSSGFVNLSAARQKVDITYDADYAPNTDISEQRGVNGSQIDSGLITYDTTVADNVEYCVTVTATYEGVSVTESFSIIFTHQPLVLNRIDISGAPQNLVVDPVRTQTYTLSAQVKDQYGQRWSWDAVEAAYSPGGRLNLTGEEDVVPWTIELAQGSTLPEDGSIRISGTKNETLTVASTATNRTITLNAIFKVPNINNSGDDFIFKSVPYTINITRELSKPTGIVVDYGVSTFVPGTKSTTGSDNDRKFSPTVTVTDQYRAVMNPSDYNLSFSMRVVGSTDDKVYLETTTETVEGAEVETVIGEKTGVIVVEECAQNCTIDLSVMAGSAQTRIQIPVEREYASVKGMTIQNTSVSFPKATDPLSYSEQLTVLGETQYGEGQQIETAFIAWELASVTVGGVEYKDSDAAGKGVTLNRTSGALTFDRNLPNRASIPTKIKVRAIYTSNAISVEKELPVNLEAAKPSSVTVLEGSYINGIEVPTAAEVEDSITLSGYVLDQYNLIIPDAKLAWSITGHDPVTNSEHIKIDSETGKLTANYSADGGYATVTASYTDGTTTVSKAVDVNVIVQGQVPMYVNFRQVKNSAGETFSLVETKDSANENIVVSTAVEIPLPGVLDGPVTYDLSGRVLDQSLKILAGETISWMVDSTDNKTNATINPSNGRLTVNYTQAARDAGTSTIKVIATAGGGSARGELIITVKKQEDKATYAEPSYEVQKDSEGGDRVNASGQVIVPNRNQEPTEIKYTAKVYSQYGEEMPSEVPVFKLLTPPGTALTLATTAEGATLEMNYTMRGSVVEVAAYASGNPDFTVPASTARIQVDPGTAYAYALVLGSSAAGDDNRKTVNLPYWNTTAVSNVSSDVTYAEFEFDALVIDQADTQYMGANPVWEIATETDADGNEILPPGIRLSSKNTFKSGTNNTQVVGNRVIVEVGSTAVSPQELSKEIKLNVWTEDPSPAIGSTPYSDASYKKTLSFTVRRDSASASYLYFSSTDDRNALIGPDVDENGDATFTFSRPTSAEISKIYNVSPKVFDQYGFHITEEFVQLNLDYSESSSLAMGYQLVTTYERGESEEDGHIPLTYAIWKLPASEGETGPTPTVAGTDKRVPAGAVLMAEFNTDTGELLLYSSCTITQLRFSARSETLDTTKNITIQLSEEDRVASTVEIIRGRTGSYTLRKSSAEVILEDVSAVIYDQYGESYTKTDIVIDWALKLADGNNDGKLDDYIEYEEDNVTPKNPENYLVLLSNPNTAETSKQITIQGEQFKSSTTVMLVAQLRRRNYTQPLDILAVSNIVMRTPSSGGNYASLYFEAGKDYGKLVGPSMITVELGTYPESIPGVKTEEGYGFFGWTSDGYTLVDPLYMMATGDVVYYAVYRDVTPTKFIDGYKDMTFKPGENITRAEFLKMVVEATQPDFDPNETYTSPFTDVDENMWYANYIGYAYLYGLVDGYEDNSFKPENYITRAEASKLLADAAGPPETDSSPEFSDLNPERWYMWYIKKLYNLGVIDGYPDGTFRPNDYVTRAEAAKMVISVTDNALSDIAKRNIVDNAYCPFTDIRRNHWAYAYILRAAGLA